MHAAALIFNDGAVGISYVAPARFTAHARDRMTEEEIAADPLCGLSINETGGIR